MTTPGSEPAELDHRLAASRRARFSPELTRRYQDEVGPMRARLIVTRGFVGLALFAAYLGVDWVLTPDAFVLALVLRLGIVAPLGLAALAIVARNPPEIVREGLPAMVCLAGGVATLTIIAASHAPLRDYHHFSLVLLVMFVTVVLPVRFRIALTVVLILLALNIASYLLAPDAGWQVMALNVGIVMTASALALLAAFSVQTGFNTAYLLGQAQLDLHRQLEEVTRHDPLTGLANRRALDEAVTRLSRTPPPGGLAVIVADIDHFKSYNDSLGHPAGDICLRRVSGLIATEMRGPTDLAVRYGGEEFLMLLPDTDLWTATAVAERIRAAVEAAAMPHPGRPLDGIITLSLGVAAGRLEGPVTIGELIQGADSALYAAKNAGRNQVWPRRRVADEANVVNLTERQSGAA